MSDPYQVIITKMIDAFKECHPDIDILGLVDSIKKLFQEYGLPQVGFFYFSCMQIALAKTCDEFITPAEILKHDTAYQAARNLKQLNQLKEGKKLTMVVGSNPQDYEYTQASKPIVDNLKASLVKTLDTYIEKHDNHLMIESIVREKNTPEGKIIPLMTIGRKIDMTGKEISKNGYSDDELDAIIDYWEKAYINNKTKHEGRCDANGHKTDSFNIGKIILLIRSEINAMNQVGLNISNADSELFTFSFLELAGFFKHRGTYFNSKVMNITDRRKYVDNS